MKRQANETPETSEIEALDGLPECRGYEDAPPDEERSKSALIVKIPFGY